MMKQPWQWLLGVVVLLLFGRPPVAEPNEKP
jgi:hypothetical protein